MQKAECRDIALLLHQEDGNAAFCGNIGKFRPGNLLFVQGIQDILPDYPDAFEVPALCCSCQDRKTHKAGIAVQLFFKIRYPGNIVPTDLPDDIFHQADLLGVEFL